MDFGDHQEGVSDNQQQLQERRKTLRRHTPEQIRKLEEYVLISINIFLFVHFPC